jgi:hypothetical protein
VKLIFEGGFGAKVDQQYQQYARPATTPLTARTPVPPTPRARPASTIRRGSRSRATRPSRAPTCSATDHAGAVINGILTAQAHYIGSFVKDKRWNVASTGGTSTYPGYATVPGYGYIQVAGIDFKLDGGWMGDGYIGYSYIKAKNALTVNDSIEVLHSQGGWQFTQNYFPTAYPSGVTPVATARFIPRGTVHLQLGGLHDASRVRSGGRPPTSRFVRSSCTTRSREHPVAWTT